MSKIVKYVGLDVHKDSITIAVVNSDSTTQRAHVDTSALRIFNHPDLPALGVLGAVLFGNPGG
ncbi:hypothetical protein DESC_860007 [Desulfosarcina cetonica]|uniref:hypothetical protein n=1 Tax=Desulfosarcina cetonica TaxID=90730 RepID=UPI0006CFCF6B|nr:hypothetical protein [Desulfosarcina cetonica]VTR70831.1 hypothetical protein DESC_860007 [Desulfosarcina cetonica]